LYLQIIIIYFTVSLIYNSISTNALHN